MGLIVNFCIKYFENNITKLIIGICVGIISYTVISIIFKIKELNDIKLLFYQIKWKKKI